MTVMNEESIEPFAQGISDEQKALVRSLKANIADVVNKYPPHQAFCTYGTYVRYLRARNWNLHKAKKMLLDTLKWREEYKPEEITWEEIESEARLGKVHILDQFDKDGRPVVFMRPRNEVAGGNNELKLKWVVYVMEHASRIADAQSPDGKMAWLLDYVGYNRKNQPSWRVSMSTLSIVQNHYPERLGKAVNYKPPLLFEIFWKAIRPFVDPVTRDKLVFLNSKDDQVMKNELENYFDLEYLDEGVCGKLPEGAMWSYEEYKQKMIASDEQYAAKIKAVTSS